MTDTVNHKENPILLTPDNLGHDYMTKLGTQVTIDRYHPNNVEYQFEGSDGFMRKADGTATVKLYSLVSAISEQVA